MLVFPHSKVNLGLYVTSKRSDGYHTLESIFLPIALHDSLDVIRIEKKSFEMEILGMKIDGNTEDNICAKAWNLLHDKHGIGGAKSILLKNIPMGAGLGGGSSDGAFMLKVLNELYQLTLSHEQLKEYAAQLGSDCPFFIENSSKYVSGRGELLELIDLDLKGYFITVVNPGIHISTKEAFSKIEPKEAPFNLKTIDTLPIESWKQYIHNQFEEAMIQYFPVIDSIKKQLYSAGAHYASMSGSGSSIYGIFSEKKEFSSLFPNCFCRTVEIL